MAQKSSGRAGRVQGCLPDPSPKRQARRPGASKHMAIPPIPCCLLRLPNRSGLKSYLRSSAMLVKSSSITSSDASTHFRPAWKTGWKA